MKHLEDVSNILPEKTEAAKEKSSEETIYPEGITDNQKRLLDALRANPEIPKGDLGWMEERILHPERFKAPNKPYGDRTAPMPWAQNDPADYETIKEAPDFCHDLAHGSTVRMC